MLLKFFLYALFFESCLFFLGGLTVEFFFLGKLLLLVCFYLLKVGICKCGISIQIYIAEDSQALLMKIRRLNTYLCQSHTIITHSHTFSHTYILQGL